MTRFTPKEIESAAHAGYDVRYGEGRWVVRSPEYRAHEIEIMRAALAALPSPPVQGDGDLPEMIAAVIDPEAYDEVFADDNEEVAAIFVESWDLALLKAHTIFALLPAPSPGLERLKGAFIAGFKHSGEGWNGEYPFEGVDMSDARWSTVIESARAFATEEADQARADQEWT